MDDIICWQPHGRSFQVRKPKDFEQIVMKRFFNQTKISSFRRQLNLYDFKRITHGPDSGSYYHEMFLRGKPLQASKMVRTKVKGTKFRATSSPDAEPNFYTLPFLPPTRSQDSSFSKNGSVSKPGTSERADPCVREENDTSIRSHPNVSKEKNNANRTLPEVSTGVNMNVVPLLNVSGVYAPNHLYQINQLLASSGNLSNISCIQPNNIHQNVHLPHALPNTNSSSTNNAAYFPSFRNIQMFQQQVDDTINLGESGDSKSSNSTSKRSNNSKAEDVLEQVSSQSRGNTISASQPRYSNEYEGYDDLQRAILANQLQTHTNTIPIFGMKLNTSDSVLTGLRMDHQQKAQSENANEKKNIGSAVCNTTPASSNSASV